MVLSVVLESYLTKVKWKYLQLKSVHKSRNCDIWNISEKRPLRSLFRCNLGWWKEFLLTSYASIVVTTNYKLSFQEHCKCLN